MKSFLSLLKIDLLLAARNRGVLFFNYLFPLVFFFFFAWAFDAGQGRTILLVVAMVIVIGILGNGLFGAGMRAVQEREENILRRYKVTPITPVPLLAASMITGVLIYLPSVVLLLFLANRFYGMALPADLFSLFLFICIGTIAFRALGLIIAAVVNSSQEATILTQLVYMPMLFLSGATIPLARLPEWAQIVTQFIPATYLMSGISGIIQHGESVLQNSKSVAALLVAAGVGLFIATKLFRWEKEEKLRPAAKVWVIAVLLPFFALGGYQAWSRQDIAKAKILWRDLRRGNNWLVENARIFVGDGQVYERGAILVKGGKIAAVYQGSAPDAESLKAEKIDAAGKTLLPGLIDLHVHLGASGGFYEDMSKAFDPANMERALAAYLYCGVTAVRSAGDQLNELQRLRGRFGTGEKVGAELFFCGPLFTTEGGHGTQYGKFMPEALAASFNAQFVRLPKSEAEARAQVDALAVAGVDAIKAVLEAGVPGYTFRRLDPALLRAITEAAHAHNLPVAIHTGNAADVAEAVTMGPDSIEHGSVLDVIADEVFARMAEQKIAYNPTLSVVEGFTNFARGDTASLKRSLVQQVTTRELLSGTEAAAQSERYQPLRDGLRQYPMSMETGGRNLRQAHAAGVMLITGSDAGNFLVLHGPTVQRELELWVAAGIPVEVALQAATGNAAKVLRAEDRIGTITVGKEASFLIVDGNPLQDVKALSAISAVFFKGERINRSELFEQK